MTTPQVGRRLHYRLKGESRQRQKSRMSMACGLKWIMGGERGTESKREATDQERWPLGRETKRSSLNWLSYRAVGLVGAGGSGSPAPGREGFRVGGSVRRAGESPRY